MKDIPWRSVRKRFAAVQQRWRAVAGSSAGRRWLKGARIAFVAGIVAYLVWQLLDMGLVQVAQGLPVKPQFYALLLLVYFTLPAAQILAYRVTWSFPLRHGIPAFLKKRILNVDVLGYSGEVFLYSWAARHVDARPVALMETIRDQNIISSAASTLLAVVLVTVFLFTGQVTLSDLVGERTQGTIIAGALAVGLVLVILVRVWKYLFSMPWRPASVVFGIHIARVLLRQTAEIAMWHVAMPEVPLKVWFTYAAITIAVTRIPFIQVKDLVAMSIAVGLAGVMGVEEVHIYALFAAVVLVQRGISLLFFAILPTLERRGLAGRSPV